MEAASGNENSGEISWAETVTGWSVQRHKTAKGLGWGVGVWFFGFFGLQIVLNFWRPVTLHRMWSEFFFFFFCHTFSIWMFLGQGQGPNLSCSCDLHHSYGKARSSSHCRVRDGGDPSHCSQRLNPLHRSGNSKCKVNFKEASYQSRNESGLNYDNNIKSNLSTLPFLW